MAAKTPFYITTAISYPNGAPHIGHAYEAVATDAIARFKRLDGYDVFFLTGTDEHGQKMQQTAARRRPDRRASCATATCRASRPWSRGSNCSNDDFIHTTEERHYRSSMAIWQRMEQAGDIYLDKYAGWYSVRDEAYYAEDETHLNEHGKRIATKTGTPVEWVEEESYFFRLSAYQQKLLDLYEKRPGLRAAARALQRGGELREGRAAGPLDLAHDLRLGRAGAGQPEARHVCLGRRADQLHHRPPAFPTTRARSSRATGRPTCTSSARTSCASTRSTGRPS